MEEEENHLYELGNFFGVYILNCKGPERKGDVYIGFTVHPQRRIRQHNREIKGGAWKTKKNKGNWDMVLIIHGFRSKIAALQFEWAWQNPQRSKRLSHLKKKSNSENKFTYKLRVLGEMLNSGPWNRLPLTIQWLKQEYIEQFPVNNPPPLHMPIAYGQLRMAKKATANSQEEEVEQQSQKICIFCNNEKPNTKDEDRFFQCIVKTCDFVGHVNCFAEHFMKVETKEEEEKAFLIPIAGICPGCGQHLSWGDLVRQRRYLLVETDEQENVDDDEEEERMSTQDSQDDQEFQ